jgi:hypothetical protein
MVDGTRRPEACQFTRETSDGERGGAEVTAATTQSAESRHRIRTGRIFDALPSVKGIFASQISPGDGIVVKPFIFRRITVQKWAMAARTLKLPLAINPGSQFQKIFMRQLFNGLFDLLDFTHGVKLQPNAFSGKMDNG